MSRNEEGIKTFLAGGALEAKRRVKIKAGTTTTPPEVVHAGAGEDFIGVTSYAANQGGEVAITLKNSEGTFEIECTVGTAIANGTLLYGAADGKCSDTASGTSIGYALQPGATGQHLEVALSNVQGSTAATVSIADAGNFTAQTTVEGALQEIYPSVPTTIADPGNGGAIPVSRSGIVPITTTGAQTRILAIPAKAGIELDLSLDVAGGNCVITAAAAINQAGNNTITLAAAGAFIALKSVQKAGALVWRVAANDGATLSTV